MKRLFDIIVSVIGLAFLSPLLIAISLLIKLDGGPVLFKQTRVGKNGVEFSIYKFRSMVVNAEKLGGYSTISNDKRITKVGAVIRKTSLDEIPQLINVIEGNMSIVGPRPDVPAQRKGYTKAQWELRTSVMPGITGLAQATLRSKATWQQRYNLDVEYINKSSFSYDLMIIVITVKQVLLKGGN